MDKMAQAYVSGMYDDDIVTEGPVVHKLDDFETLNKMVEAKNKTMKSWEYKNMMLHPMK